MSDSKWLRTCAALAIGEFAALSASDCCDLWPLALLLAALVSLYGYGLGWVGWMPTAILLLGLALGFRSAVAETDFYRERPWMRGRERMMRSVVEPVDSAAACVRRELSRRVGIGLSPRSETVALNRAILLGERGRLPWRTKRLFVESGAMHVFAISGLHVMAIATVLSCLVRLLLLVPSRWAEFCALPILWGYVLVIGAPPSAMRAALMASFGALALVCWRRPNGLVAWSLTFLLVHLSRPEMIVNVGSVLSFAVMLSIQLTGDVLRRYGGRWWVPAVTTIVAWAVGVPIAAHVFGRITPGGLVANLVLLGLAKCTVYAGALGLVASFVSNRLTVHLNGLSALFTESMLRVSEGVSRLPGSNWETGPWSYFACASWYFVLLLLVLLISLLRRRRVAFEIQGHSVRPL